MSISFKLEIILETKYSGEFIDREKIAEFNLGNSSRLRDRGLLNVPSNERGFPDCGSHEVNLRHAVSWLNNMHRQVREHLRGTEPIVTLYSMVANFITEYDVRSVNPPCKSVIKISWG